jgi:hypothetical protein
VKPPIFRPAAAADVEDAYLWYQGQQAGLGGEFVAAVQTVLESITINLKSSLSFIVKLAERCCGVSRTACSTASLTIRLSWSHVCMVGEIHDGGNREVDDSLAFVS